MQPETPCSQYGTTLTVKPSSSRFEEDPLKTERATSSRAVDKAVKPVKGKPKGRWLVTPAKLVVFLEILLLILMGGFSMWNVLKYNLVDREGWEFLAEPAAQHFESISISSNSETCNELTRLYAMEHHHMATVALYMLLCLDAAEPQASGMGGASVLLYADAKTGACNKSLGFTPIAAEFLDHFITKIRANSLNEHMGLSAQTTPGHIISIIRLVELLENEPNPYRAFDHLNQELLMSLRFPITKRILDALREGNVVQQMQYRKAYTHLSKKRHSIVRMFTPENFLEETKILVQQMKPRLVNLPIHEIQNFLAQSGLVTTVNGKVPAFVKNEVMHLFGSWKDSPAERTQMFSGTLCSTSFRSTERWNSTGEFLEQMLSRRGEIDVKDGEDAAVSPSFYREISKALTNLARTGNESKILDRIQLENKFPFKRRINTPTSNVFSIVDHVEQTAISSVATLGSSFGSLDDFVLDNQMGSGVIHMNNLMSFWGRLDKFIGTDSMIMEPVIFMKDKKIEIAYAGNGGNVDWSLDFPRKLTSLSLSLLFDLPITESLTTPLLFSQTAAHEASFTKGIPYYAVNKAALLSKNQLTGRKKVAPGEKRDYVAAVQGHQSIFFNGEPNQDLIIPSGL